MKRAIKVKEIALYVRKLISRDPLLSNIAIEGEISNMSYANNTLYFSLKDEEALLRCVLFRYAEVLPKSVSIVNGMKVCATGYLTTYPKNSCYQLHVTAFDEIGIGELYRLYQELKGRLEKEGLFEAKYKKPLPAFPMTIGIVTSPSGAAIRDILQTIKRRFPIVNLIIYPSRVQGNLAHQEMIKALDYLEHQSEVDVILLARGGGSFEDLNEFNNESLIRKIFSLKTPVISAVGHETDTMLSDYVADLRAATPTAAAEMATPDLSSLKSDLHAQKNKMFYLAEKRLETEKLKLEQLRKALDYNSPEQRIIVSRQNLENIQNKMSQAISHRLDRQLQILNRFNDKLTILNPKEILKKGYSIVFFNGKAVTSKDELPLNSMVRILLHNGSLTAIVTNKEGE